MHMAHKKGGGITNGRDSESKRWGKKIRRQHVLAGNIYMCVNVELPSTAGRQRKG